MPTNEVEVEQLRWKKLPVLDDGFVCLVDVMGDDQAVVQAARVSYGEGTRQVSDDRGLIRYLLRHRHTTPFEMAELKFLVRVPMDTWRQWIRHRTACLAGDSVLYFDLPGANRRGRRQRHNVAIEDFFRMWHEGTVSKFSAKRKPTFSERVDADQRYTIAQLARLVERREEDLRNMVRDGRLKGVRERGRIHVLGREYLNWANSLHTLRVSARDRLRRMRLRMCDEAGGEISHTRVSDVWSTGKRPVFRVILENGYQLKMTADHRCLTENGWLTLREATALRLRENGGCTWNAQAPALAVNGIAVHPRPAKKRLPPVRRLKRTWSKIARIEYVGAEETYDLSVTGPFHNFVANGFVVHNSVNEYSTRYSLAIDAAQHTPAGEWRTQAATNRQGSGDPLPTEVGQELSAAEAELIERARQVYQQRIELGVAREQARKDLPLSTYTEAYWKIDLHNLLHFLALRMDDHAQLEIRQYAKAIGEGIVRPLFPYVWEAFVDYRLEGTFLTRLDCELVQRLTARLAAAGRAIATEEDFLAVQPDDWARLKRSREREECRQKLQRLGILRASPEPSSPSSPKE
ncbi:MAG: FAD-dependent thymidylate synthase [Pirellulales bacterium]